MKKSENFDKKSVLFSINNVSMDEKILSVQGFGTAHNVD